MYELLLEGREGAGAVRLGGWCQGRGRRWRCSLGWMCVVGKRGLLVE